MNSFVYPELMMNRMEGASLNGKPSAYPELKEKMTETEE